MASLAELVAATTADTSFGVPLLGSSIYRWAVLRAAAEDGVRYDGTIVYDGGTDYNDGFEWEDLTSEVRGFACDRGAQQLNDRIRNGTGDLRLTNPDLERSSWYGPDGIQIEDLIRVCHIRTTGGFVGGYMTGRVIAANDVTVGPDADQYLDVTIADLPSWLAKIDDKALAAPTGLGHSLTSRVEDILDRSDWPFGGLLNDLTLHQRWFTNNEYASSLSGVGEYPLPTLQATDYAANRLTELYRAADSCGAEVHSTSLGRLVTPSWRNGTYAPAEGGYSWQMFVVDDIDDGDYVRTVVDPSGDLAELRLDDTDNLSIWQVEAGSFRIVGDQESIENHVTMARAGGSQIAPTSDLPSIARYGVRTGSGTRTDMLTRANPWATTGEGDSYTDDEQLAFVQHDYATNFVTTEPYLIEFSVAHYVGVNAEGNDEATWVATLVNAFETFSGRVLVLRDFPNGNATPVLFSCRVIGCRWSVANASAGPFPRLTLRLRPFAADLFDDFIGDYTAAT